MNASNNGWCIKVIVRAAGRLSFPWIGIVVIVPREVIWAKTRWNPSSEI
jgi:hypothetical protein